MDLFAESSPHRPLGDKDASEIRLVALHPGDWDDPVVCTLRHVSLNDDITYNAVSYVWGDPTPVSEILLDGVPYLIAANLFQALHRLRDYDRWHPREDEEPSESLLLWIDALCINQGDKIERSFQIRKMTQIYSKAARLFACIGEAAPYKEDLIEKLFSIVWRPLKRDEYREEYGDDGIDDDSHLTDDDLNRDGWFSWKELAKRVEADPLELQQSMVDLCTNTFFGRIWIVQELTLAQRLDITVLYGPHSVNSALLLELLMALWVNHKPNQPKFLEICGITGNAFAMLSGGYRFARPAETTISDLVQHVIELLQATQHFEATEPRDRIYALLGLVNKELLPANLLPSYDEPIGKVYQAWTQFLLENTGDLQIIDQSFAPDSTVPTWVSSLSLDKTTRQTVPAHPSSVCLSKDGRVLHVKGELICFVLGAYSPSELDVTLQTADISSLYAKAAIIKQARNMEDSLIRHVRADQGHGASYIPYLFDLMMHAANPRTHIQAWEANEALCESMTTLYEQLLTNDPTIWESISDNTDTNPALLALQKILTTYDWVALTTGAIHIVEAKARDQTIRPADEVYLLQGSSGLTILRRKTDEESFLRVAFVGQGIEHEVWPPLEQVVNGESESVIGLQIGGYGSFRPRIGVVDIAIS